MLQPNLQPTVLRSTFTAAHAGAALRWFDSMREPKEWGLTIEEQIELLGGIKRRTFQAWKSKALAGEEVELSRDLLERLSLLLGIYKGLKIIAPAGRPDLARSWFSTPNAGSPFHGRSPKAFLLEEGTMEALYAVRRYFDAARG